MLIAAITELTIANVIAVYDGAISIALAYTVDTTAALQNSVVHILNRDLGKSHSVLNSKSKCSPGIRNAEISKNYL